MDVYINSEIAICNEFIPEKGKKKESTSVVISPLKVSQIESEMTLKVTSGCNMWQGCFNPKCHFSIAARRLPRTPKEGARPQEPGS